LYNAHLPEISVGKDGTIHAFTYYAPGYPDDLNVEYSYLVNVPSQCRITNLLDGSVVRDAIKLLFEADPGDDMTAVENIELRFGDDSEWIPASDGVVGSYIWDTKEEEDGFIHVSCRAWDGFAWSGTRLGVEVRNNDPPRFTQLSPDDDQEFQDTVPISGEAYDEWGFNDGWSVEFSWDGQDWSVLPGVELTDDNNLAFTTLLQVPTFERGEWTLHLRVTDGILTSETRIIRLVLNWLPDLEVMGSDIYLEPPDARQGDPCAIEVTVRNVGRGTSGTTSVALTTSRGPVSVPLAVPVLEPGNEVVVSFPWKASKGAVNFTVVVDDGDIIEEEDEVNNIAHKEFKVPSKGDDGNGIPGVSLVGALSAIMMTWALVMIRHTRTGTG